jgi:hypothetical protein
LTARRVCARCSVQRECLECALTNGEEYGIFGGTSAKERRKLARAGCASSLTRRPLPTVPGGCTGRLRRCRMEVIAIRLRMARAIGGSAMRRLMAVLVGVLVLGLAASLTFASEPPRRVERRDLWRGAARGSLDQDGARADRRIVVVSRNERETDIDNPPNGPSPGDELVLTGTLHRPGVRRPIGRLDVHFVATLVTQREFRVLANIVSNLPHGEVEATGVARFTEMAGDFEFGVRWGTDGFDTVGGELNVVEPAGPGPVRLVYDLEDLD